MNLTQRLIVWFDRHALGLNAWLVIPYGLLATVIVRVVEVEQSWSALPQAADAGTRLRYLLSVVGLFLLVGATILRVRSADMAFAAGVAGGLLCAPAYMDTPVLALGLPLVLLVLYSSAAHGSKPTRQAALISVFGVTLLASFLEAYRWRDAPNRTVLFVLLLMLLAVLLVAWGLGDVAWHRRMTLKMAEDRAARLEQEAVQERALAAQDERARIAREMHDIVAHSLAVIVTQADGGRYAAAQDPAAATRTLETVASTARQSLAEMRGLLGVLRTDESTEYSSSPGLERIPELIEAAQRSGLAAEYSSPTDLGSLQLPSGAELVLYRAAQEMLTNCLKHGGPGSVARLELSPGRRSLVLSCTSLRSSAAPHAAARSDSAREDSAPGYTDPALHSVSVLQHAPGRGSHRLGLQGMAERVQLYGGVLRAEPLEKGFRTTVVVPVDDSPQALPNPPRRTP